MLHLSRINWRNGQKEWFLFLDISFIAQIILHFYIIK